MTAAAARTNRCFVFLFILNWALGTKTELVFSGLQVVGWQIRGVPEKVYLRGNLLVDGETWNGEPGGGAWLARNPHAPIM